MADKSDLIQKNVEKTELLKGVRGKRNYSESVAKILSSGQGVFNCFPNIDKLVGQDIGTKIIIEARTIESQAANPRSDSNIKTGSQLALFRFIAPNEIVETVSHTWESYESLATKVAEKAASLSKMEKEIEGLKRAGTNFSLDSLQTGGGWSDTLRSVSRLLLQGDVTNNRVDMPLVYKDSEKRRYEFTFQLAYYKEPEKEILAPVKALETLSCASLPKDTNGSYIAGVKPPCVFTITTEPQTGLLYVENAALLTVQPTFKGPFYQGYPTTCELHLTFQEIDPLWDKTFAAEGKDKILVSETRTNSGVK